MADYGKLIDRNLTRVFKQAGSLLTPAVFNLKSGESFNFNTAKPVVSASSSLPMKVLVIKTDSRGETVKKQLLIEKVDNLDVYDSVTLLGQEWKFEGILLDNGYTQIIEIIRG